MAASHMVACPALQEGWGDDAADAIAANPHYSPDQYKALSKSARRNLAMVNESAIDYDLIETVIDLIDAQHGPGAVLVFLPGKLHSPRARPYVL